MTETVTISAQRRIAAGKGPARAIRRAGRIPAVIYGDHKEPLRISLDPREFNKALHKAGFFAKLLDLVIDDEVHHTVPRDVQFHPVTDVPIHVDFLRVGAKTRLHIAVPVLFINHDKSVGLKRGGVLNVVYHEIEMICAADSIPDHITVDLSGLDIGDSVHMGAIALPDGVKPTHAASDFTVASIAPPTVSREEEAAAATAAAATPAKK